ncbi:MAG: asparagine synthase (glutamine-hydrolyzing), partial [Roseibium sp.]|uniref:asparagine synthase (glutamine-hydrolyzing) n=1 Tax=Roseibium sp. TaxID=1936156 RepID=UPI00260F7DEE
MGDFLRMCRIFGVVSDQEVDEENLFRASRCMLSGGPDQQWVKHGKNWSIGANRLAIQGIDGGKQPFQLNNLICVFNGEIYNHRALRELLVCQGYAFSDFCDGNIILPLYQEFGKDFLTRLEGMFAIAILELDAEGKCVSAFLASDQSAMKTLFYRVDETGLYFASSLKALNEITPNPFSIRDGFVYEYVSRKAVWGPDTVYEGVNVLGSGETLSYSATSGGHRLGTYQHEFAPLQIDGLDQTSEQLDALLHQEIASMADVDVNICSVLSGGLDSSYITSIVKKYTDKLDAFHISYDHHWPGDESHYARMVAQAHNVKLEHIKVDVAQLPNYVAEYIRHLDQPNYAPHCLSTYCLFKEIGNSGYKVAFTGEGADELFCGYDRLIRAATDTDENWFEKFFAIYGISPFRNGSYFKKGYLENLCETNYAPPIEPAPNRSRMQSVLRYDSKSRFPYYILRRVDSLSMASSVEVRMPFLQPRVIDFARKLPDEYLYSSGVGKQCVLRAGKKYLP